MRHAVWHAPETTFENIYQPALVVIPKVEKTNHLFYNGKQASLIRLRVPFPLSAYHTWTAYLLSGISSFVALGESE